MRLNLPMTRDFMTKQNEVVEVIKSYPYMTAGKTWFISNVALKKAPDGSVVIPGREIIRMQRFVANEIVGQAVALSADELQFLCDITDTKYNAVAEFLGVSKSNISLWKKIGNAVPFNESVRLKKWFWQKVFSQDVEKNIGDLIPMPLVFDEGKLLAFLRERGRKFSDDETLQTG